MKANDDDPRVQVEIRAAELFALTIELGHDPDEHMFVEEFNGWEKFRLGHDRALYADIRDQQMAGYLGAAMAWHHGIIDGFENLVEGGVLPKPPENK